MLNLLVFCIISLSFFSLLCALGFFVDLVIVYLEITEEYEAKKLQFVKHAYNELGVASYQGCCKSLLYDSMNFNNDLFAS